MSTAATIPDQLRELEGRTVRDYFTSPAADYVDFPIFLEADGNEADEDEAMGRTIDHIEFNNANGWRIAEITLHPEVDA